MTGHYIKSLNSFLYITLQVHEREFIEACRNFGVDVLAHHNHILNDSAKECILRIRMIYKQYIIQ